MKVNQASLQQCRSCPARNSIHQAEQAFPCLGKTTFVVSVSNPPTARLKCHFAPMMWKAFGILHKSCIPRNASCGILPMGCISSHFPECQLLCAPQFMEFLQDAIGFQGVLRRRTTRKHPVRARTTARYYDQGFGSWVSFQYLENFQTTGWL